MSDKVTVLFVNGPMDGESREFKKGHIPRVIETMVIGKQPAGENKAGRYELRYVFIGDRLSENEFHKQNPDA